MSDRRNGKRLAVDRPSRPKESERRTRTPQILWDRIRISLFLGVAFLVIVWVRDANDPSPFRETVRETVVRYWWLLALLALEIARQFVYFVQEQVPSSYERSKARRARVEERRERVDPFLRFRLARVAKWLLFLWILGSILEPIVEGADPAAGELNPITALARAPALLFSVLPMILQVILILFVAVGQFAAIFWFLSRGGVEVIMPDDIETRFSDVKGQDSVLDRVKAPTLLIVGERDEPVIDWNREAQQYLRCETALEIVPGAPPRLEEPGPRERVAALAAAWLRRPRGG
jgi:cell division protease FtsH